MKIILTTLLLCTLNLCAVVLDARNADKFALRHLRGAVSLPFTEVSDASQSLASQIDLRP